MGNDLDTECLQRDMFAGLAQVTHESSTCTIIIPLSCSLLYQGGKDSLTILMLSLKLGLSISVAIIDIEETSLSMVAIYPI